MNYRARASQDAVGWMLIGVGALFVIAGIFGLGFHQSGLVVVQHAVIALTLGAIVTAAGVMVSLPTPPPAPRPAATTSRRRSSPVSVYENAVQQQAPDRVKVHSWRDEPLALPPAA